MAPQEKSFTRSTQLNPNVGLEDQDMEMTPVVMGPPAYGSPDPNTQARRLAPLNESELGKTISEDYAQDHLDAGAVTAPEDAAEKKSASAKKE